MSNVSQLNDSAVSGVNYVDYGVLWLLDVLYLILLSGVGTIGNLLIISSIIYQRRVNKHGNIFIINLAVVDLIVTGFVIPVGVANVITGRDVLSDVACVVAGSFLCLACACSVSSLACIAFNRYWFVVRRNSYKRVFNRNVLYAMVVVNWIWGILLVVPTVLGWSKQHYDVKVLLCTLNLGQSMSYNIFLMGFGISVPISITAISYWKLFAVVSKRSARRRRWNSRNTPCSIRAEQNKLNKEWNFARTLLATVLALLLCFLPFGITTLVDQTAIPPTVSRIAGRLILTNFTMNFVIYGAMNPIYRKGYAALIRCMFCIKKSRAPSEIATDYSAPNNGARIEMEIFKKPPKRTKSLCTVGGKKMKAKEKD